MSLRTHKTKIVATIGPASDAPEILEQMIRAGLSVARLNFSHGTFEEHAARIERLRAAEKAAGGTIALMADLPGPKMRIGQLAQEPVQVEAGGTFVLTSREIVGDVGRASMTFDGLPRVVKQGDRLFLNDGIIQLQVERVEAPDVHCRVLVGGELRSRKGLNLPGIHLGISAFTEPRSCLSQVCHRAWRRCGEPVVCGIGGRHPGGAGGGPVPREPAIHSCQDRTGRSTGAH